MFPGTRQSSLRWALLWAQWSAKLPWVQGRCKESTGKQKLHPKLGHQWKIDGQSGSPDKIKIYAIKKCAKFRCESGDDEEEISAAVCVAFRSDLQSIQTGASASGACVALSAPAGIGIVQSG